MPLHFTYSLFSNQTRKSSCTVKKFFLILQIFALSPLTTHLLHVMGETPAAEWWNSGGEHATETESATLCSAKFWSFPGEALPLLYADNVRLMNDGPHAPILVIRSSSGRNAGWGDQSKQWKCICGWRGRDLEERRMVGEVVNWDWIKSL